MGLEYNMPLSNLIAMELEDITHAILKLNCDGIRI